MRMDFVENINLKFDLIFISFIQSNLIDLVLNCFRTVGVCYKNKRNLSPQWLYLLSISNQFEELISWHQETSLTFNDDNVTLHFTRGEAEVRCDFKRDKERKNGICDWHVWKALLFDILIYSIWASYYHFYLLFLCSQHWCIETIGTVYISTKKSPKRNWINTVSSWNVKNFQLRRVFPHTKSHTHNRK